MASDPMKRVTNHNQTTLAVVGFRSPEISNFLDFLLKTSLTT